jgi:hypothetical protein
MNVSIAVPSLKRGADGLDAARANQQCTVFYEFFAAATILVCIVYYLVVRVTLSAMGAVALRRHPSVPVVVHAGEYDDDDDDEEDEGDEDEYEENNGNDDKHAGHRRHGQGKKKICKKVRDSAASLLCNAPPSDAIEEEKATKQPHSPSASISSFDFSTDSVDHATSSSCMKNGASSGDPPMLSSSSSAEDEDEDSDEIKREKKADIDVGIDASTSDQKSTRNRNASRMRARRTVSLRKVAPTVRRMRMSALKVWTNIYGLSIGVYCLVYSLLFPNELSAFVFCVSTLAISLQQVLSPCISAYVYDESEQLHHSMAAEGRRHSGRFQQGDSLLATGNRLSHMSCTQRWKRVVGWLCLFHDSIRYDIVEGIRDVARGSGRTSRRARRSSVLKHCIRGGTLTVPLLIVLCTVGLVFKALHMSDCPSVPLSSIAMSSSALHSGNPTFLKTGVRREQMEKPVRAPINISESPSDHENHDIVVDGHDKVAMDNADAISEEQNMTAITLHDLQPSAAWPSETISEEQNMTAITLHDLQPSAAWPSETISEEQKETAITLHDLQPSAPLPAIPLGTGSRDEQKTGSQSTQSPMGMFVSVAFPIVGVFMIRSMKTAENIRETMELAVPALGINSLCVACIIFMLNPICFRTHFSLVVNMDPSYYWDSGATDPVHAIGHISDAVRNQSGINETDVHQNLLSLIDGFDRSREYDAVMMQLQAILALFVLPFPLVCSIVCIVSAGKNRRFMVSTPSRMATAFHEEHF